MRTRFRAESRGGEKGTASVEAVAVVPLLLLAVLAAAQLGVAGQALWSAAVAARAGARAAIVGGEAKASARRALPQSMRAGSRVRTGAEGVWVEVPVPRLLPIGAPLRVRAGTSLEADG